MSRDLDRFAAWARRYELEGDKALIPAATVIMLRDTTDGLETLMLHRNSKLEFVGGMWVFPGGRLDPGDYPASRDALEASRNAAVREALEESGQKVNREEMVTFAHWTPPPIAPKRFSTWFFAARAGGEIVTIDDGEIKDHGWMSPSSALERQSAGDIELAPPTWVTLHDLSLYDSVDAALAGLDERPTRFYLTHIARLGDIPIALWEGDAGYDTADPEVPGSRHRLVMETGNYVYDSSGLS